MILSPTGSNESGVNCIINAWLDNLDIHPEDQALLRSPGRQLGGLGQVDTDAFIIGGGNA
jgi:hypothetical protein